ncbi:MAG TPA: GntR family transcriptional regulator [Trebonia sp.]|jgi:DNA-binding GntR family transcriptional regulator|nr:GntR family transcriptional regulator [Trebonia sp.]
MVVQHRQIAEDLRRQIAASVYPPGSCLPPETEMAARYGVSRGTVRQAVVALQAEGLLDTRQGARRTVLRTAPAQNLARLQSFAQWAAENGRSAGGLILRLRRTGATAEQTAALQVAAGEEVLHVLRLRTLDGEPILVERIVYASWVADAVAGLPRDTVSLTEGLAEEAGVTHGHGRHAIEAIGARVLEASLLGIRRGSPMLRHRYVISTADGRPFVTSDDRYKPGTMSITVDNAAPARSIARGTRPRAKPVPPA